MTKLEICCLCGKDALYYNEYLKVYSCEEHKIGFIKLEAHDKQMQKETVHY